MGGFTRPASEQTTNRDWWPNALDLSPLRMNSALTDPMGTGFDYAKEFATLDLDAVRRDQQPTAQQGETGDPAVLLESLGQLDGPQHA